MIYREIILNKDFHLKFNEKYRVSGTKIIFHTALDTAFVFLIFMSGYISNSLNNKYCQLMYYG